MTKAWIISNTLVVIFLLALPSCVPETIPCGQCLSLPEETQFGSGEMGFLIDEEVWLVSGRTVFGELAASRENELDIRLQNGVLNVRGAMNRRCDTLNIIDQEIEFEIELLGGEGVYYLSKSEFNNPMRLDDYWAGDVFLLDSGFVDLTFLDPIDSIASGIFEFKVYNRFDSLDTKVIRAGRFDGTY